MFFFIPIVIYEIVKFYVTLPKKKKSNWEPSSPATVASEVFCVLIYDFSE